MFSLIRNSKWAAAPLTALMIAAMWGNALSAVFCPHMRGRKCCFVDQTHVHSQSAPRHEVPGAAHVHHQQMSDMEMEDGSVDTDASPPVLPNSELKAQQIGDVEATQSDSDRQAVTSGDEPCSHCMMHSRYPDRFPITFVENSSAHRIVMADSSRASLDFDQPAHAFVELRDHSPPGSNAPLYVLTSAFRI